MWVVGGVAAENGGRLASGGARGACPRVAAAHTKGGVGWSTAWEKKEAGTEEKKSPLANSRKGFPPRRERHHPPGAVLETKTTYGSVPAASRSAALAK